MPKNFSCNLGSINLSEFVINPYTVESSFDFQNFTNAVSAGVTYLDKIIDLNLSRHPLKEQSENSKNFRNIGLGTFGYAGMLMKLGLKYGEKETIEFTEKLYSIMFRTAVKTSVNLAIAFNPFPAYTPEVWESAIIKNHFSEEEINDYKRFGIRNCSLLSIAPNGSTATLLGESGGIEPEFAIKYTRRTVGMTDNQDTYYIIYCKAANEYINKYSTNELPEYFVSAMDVDPFKRVLTQGAIQKHIDTGISSTINLLETATEEEMAKLYIEAWKNGCKGLTIFRNGCKRQGILTTNSKVINDDVKHDNIHTLQRGDIIQCSNDLIGKKRKIISGCGSLHILAYFDPDTGDMMEVYLNMGSQGGCLSNTNAISRLLSLLCRAGVDVNTIKDQLDSVVACPAYVSRTATKHDTSKGKSCPSAIGFALIDMWNEMQNDLGLTEEEKKNKPITTVKTQFKIEPAIEQQTDKCPECGSQVNFEGGCVVCRSCGWSKCG